MKSEKKIGPKLEGKKQTKDHKIQGNIGFSKMDGVTLDPKTGKYKE